MMKYPTAGQESIGKYHGNYTSIEHQVVLNHGLILYVCTLPANTKKKIIIGFLIYH